MVTDDERRAAAARIRELRKHAWNESSVFDLLGCAVEECGLDDTDQLFARLADLIEPDPDITCELELTFASEVRTPVRVYECDQCGKSCDIAWAEDYAYCPYCGRLNTAREVEVDDD